MSQFVTYNHDDYSGGLNNTTTPSEIARNEASKLYNWDITTQGKLTQRAGLTLVGSSLGSGPITGFGAFLRATGKDLLVTCGTGLYYLNGSSWSQLASTLTNTSGLNIWMENINPLGKIIIGNEDNTLKSWDRTSTTLNTCLTDLGAAVPHGNVLRWHKNHLFTMNNVNVSGTKYANRVYWCNMGDPTTWDTTNNYFEVPGDGNVTGAMDLGNSLVIFKERAVQYMDGWGSTSWKITTTSSNVNNIDGEIGCVAPRGMTKVGNEVWFIDQEGNIRRIFQTDFGAFRRDVVSTKIMGTLSGINRSQLNKAVMWTHDNKVYCALPNGTDTTNSIIAVFDILASIREAQAGRKEEAWTTYTGWTPQLFADYQTNTASDLYMGDATIGNVYLVSGLDDNGVAIDCNWEGKEDDFDKPDTMKRFGYGWISSQATTGTQTIGLYASTDLSPYANISTFTLSVSGGRLGPTGTFRLGPTGGSTLGGARKTKTQYFFDQGGLTPSGKTLIFSIRHKVLGEKAEVNTFTTHYLNRYDR